LLRTKDDKSSVLCPEGKEVESSVLY